MAPVLKHLFALPALLRPALYLAAASQHAFSVQDDLLAFPQFEVKFSDDYVSEQLATSRLQHHADPHASTATAAPSHIEQYKPTSSSAWQGDGSKPDELELDYESMMLDGQRYLCSVPQVKKAEDVAGANDTLSKAEEEKELTRATDRGWELLSSMQGNCVYFISGWWSYSFCYGQGVKQFHQLPPGRNVPPFPPTEDPGVDAYYLGAYEKKDMADDEAPEPQSGSNAVDVRSSGKRKNPGYGQLVQRGESRYLVQKLSGGTKCDLTGKERRIEIQFHCNPQSSDKISLIKETATCAYLMVIQTPRLCNDVAFLPPQKDAPHAIQCSPVLADDEVEDYKRKLKAIKSSLKDGKTWEANAEAAAVMDGLDPPFDAPLQIVGDIIVGGHELVPEGTKLEKSAIVGGGKETYVDTIASSDGRILSVEEMKRLGFGDPKSVEKLKKDLEKIAQGQSWKLDVIDTPRGREYRGIIGDEDEEDGNKKAKDGDEEQGQDGEGSREEYYKEDL